VVATVPNIAQPAPASARKPRNTRYDDVMTLAISLNAITIRPPIIRGRLPRRSRRCPVGRLTTHFPNGARPRLAGAA
jgi:hypothetical protein